MVVFLLVFAVLVLLTVKACFAKALGRHTVRPYDSVFFSFLRMAFCAVIGVVLLLLTRAWGDLRVERGMLLVCLVGGLGTSASIVGWLLAVTHLPFSTVNVTMTASSILPAVLGWLLFRDAISGPKMVGFALIIAAALVINLGQGGDAAAKNRRAVGVVWLIVSALGDSFGAFAQQLYKRYYTEAGAAYRGTTYSISSFNFYVFLCAGVLLGAVFLGVYLADRARVRETGAAHGPRPAPFYRPVLLIFLIAVCMFAVTYLQTAVTSVYGLPAQVIYPVTGGGCIVTLNLSSVLIFREKPTVRMAVGSLAAIAGIVMMSLL